MDDNQRKAMFAKIDDRGGIYSGMSSQQYARTVPREVRDFKIGHIIKTVRNRNSMGIEDTTTENKATKKATEQVLTEVEKKKIKDANEKIRIAKKLEEEAEAIKNGKPVEVNVNVGGALPKEITDQMRKDKEREEEKARLKAEEERQNDPKIPIFGKPTNDKPKTEEEIIADAKKKADELLEQQVIENEINSKKPSKKDETKEEKIENTKPKEEKEEEKENVQEVSSGRSDDPRGRILIAQNGINPDGDDS